MTANSRDFKHARPLAEVAWVFLKLGAIGFGGPAAHIAMMERELVERRRWVSREDFVDLVGAVNLIPGPNSTEMAIHLGHTRAGWPGLVVAGVCFIAPAMLIVSLIAESYVRYGSLHWFAGAMASVTPVVLAIVAHAIWTMGRTAVTTPLLGVLTLAAVAAAAWGAPELGILAASGFLAGLFVNAPGVSPKMPKPALAPALLPLAPIAAGVTAFSLHALFLAFLKIGSVLFGSGYVLIAFLRSEFVVQRGWLTERQLLDAVAVGQVTPGPVFTTATFIGHLLGGVPGGLTATAGIFLPAFVFVAISGPLIPFIKRSPRASAALRGVTAASLALMAVAAFQLARGALTDGLSIGLAIASALLLLARVNATWIILAALAFGVVRALAAST